MVYMRWQKPGVGVIVYEKDIIMRPEVKAICDFFKIDPLIAISEGTLTITAPEETLRN